VENNRAIILYVYLVLRKHSRSDRHLNASQIAQYVKREFNMTEEPNRKTIYSHLSQLQELSDLGLLDWELIAEYRNSKVQGHYLVPEFTKAEIKLLCDAVISSRFISKAYSKDLIYKLSKTWNEDLERKYTHMLEFKGNDWRNYNAAFFDSIGELTNAIDLGVKVKLQYMTYDVTKQLIPKYSEDDGYIIVSPYHLVWAVNHYYLFGNLEASQQRRFLRVDKVRNVTLMSEQKVEPLPPHFNIDEYTRNQAFMFGGENERILFRGQMRILGQVIDFFGQDVEIRPLDTEYFDAVVITSIDSIKYWILQYISAIDHIRPRKLNDIIIGYLEESLSRNKTEPS